MTQELFSDAGFGRRLREARKAAGMTQAQLAGAITATGQRMHPSAIAKIESGERPVSLFEAVHFAWHLSVTLDELVTGDTPERDDLKKTKLRIRSLQLQIADCEAAESDLEERRAFLAERKAELMAAVNGAVAELAAIRVQENKEGE